MSREIKFRAWNKTENRMEYEGHFHFDKDGIVGLEQGVSWWGRLNLIPMQFTGLKDKNGKEICEGDVVRRFIAATKDYYSGEVYYSEWCRFEVGSGQWALVETDSECEDTKWEIIGNIYENPELLKGEK